MRKQQQTSDKARPSAFLRYWVVLDACLTKEQVWLGRMVHGVK